MTRKKLSAGRSRRQGSISAVVPAKVCTPRTTARGRDFTQQDFQRGIDLRRGRLFIQRGALPFHVYHEGGEGTAMKKVKKAKEHTPAALAALVSRVDRMLTDADLGYSERGRILKALLALYGYDITLSQ